ncbi:hypothetical protein CJF30_00000088 [Rutstroemia sp. NJR-2017a BBW]|nr:hypothetical protein CJF30_00000088 [Rutstroemia sp. NJR-2017a BBW]
MTTTPTSPSLGNGVQNYVRYLHIACTHEYHDDGTDIRGKQLLTLPHLDGGSDFRTFFILNPRWCPRCRDERAQKIKVSYRGRVLETDTVPVGTEEDGYTRGLCDGRINALSQPLPDFDHQTTPTSITSLPALPALETLSQILTALELTENDITSLAHQLQDQITLTDNQDEELKHAIFWHLAYMEGVKEGSALQIQLEGAAIGEEDTTVRKELMRRALL